MAALRSSGDGSCRGARPAEGRAGAADAIAMEAATIRFMRGTGFWLCAGAASAPWRSRAFEWSFAIST